MMKWILSFCIFLSGPIHAQEQDSLNLGEAYNLIEIWLDGQKDYDGLPGISASIVLDQDLAWSGGFGFADVENQVPAEATTVYSICSISKLFTSISLMQLWEAGKVRLDDPLATDLSWFDLPQQFDDTVPITLRSVLTHSSGLPRESDFPYWNGPEFKFPTTRQIKKKLKDQETLYPASTYFQYSNLGMSLLGDVVEEQSGEPFQSYVETHVLEPLQLENTHPYLPKEEWGKEMAVGYTAINRERERERLPLFDVKGLTPAAGFSSSVIDLGKFAAWIFRLRATGGTEVLKASTLKEMQRVQWMNPDWETTWGLGFAIYRQNGATVVGHGGSCPGYRSTIMMLPEKQEAYITMINAQGVSASKYAKGMRAILDAWRSGETLSDSTGFNADDYAGHYDSQPWWDELVVVPWKGGLALFWLPSDDPKEDITPIKHVAGDTFRRVRDNGELGEEIVFERNRKERVTRLWWESGYFDRIR
ncbi:MAG: beta-lactamase family protein [FCB group bacterium]|nr:beta-lactamase family protein [FCB group bacterium]